MGWVCPETELQQQLILSRVAYVVFLPYGIPKIPLSEKGAHETC